METLISNVTLVLPERLCGPEAWLMAKDGRIAGFGVGHQPDVPGARRLDGCGAYLCPGFVDTHVHGGGGADFRDGTEEAYLRALCAVENRFCEKVRRCFAASSPSSRLRA